MMNYRVYCTIHIRGANWYHLI